MKSQILRNYTELMKPRILLHVLITAFLGYYLASHGQIQWGLASGMLFGIGLVCGGASTLNHYLERDVDSKMERTKRRPIPSGKISANNALLFGIVLVLSGVWILLWTVNMLTAFLALLTAFLYVLVYTPLKQISWLNTTIGAIPGALPPLGGWAAANGTLEWGGWVLFFILFAWQHPHFYAIAWMFKDEYRKAGFKMLPVVHPDGKLLFGQIHFFSLLLIGLSVLPMTMGFSGKFYLAGTLVAGFAMFWAGLRLSRSKSRSDARALLKASVIYLPVMLALILVDSTF